MVERLVRLSEPLSAMVGVLQNPVVLPSVEEWLILKEVCQSLKPFKLVTVELAGQKNVCLSKVLLIVKGLISSLKRMKDKLTSGQGQI